MGRARNKVAVFFVVLGGDSVVPLTPLFIEQDGHVFFELFGLLFDLLRRFF